MVNNDWDEVLKDEVKKEYFRKLWSFVNNAYESSVCYPDYMNIFNALRYTTYENVMPVKM